MLSRAQDFGYVQGTSTELLKAFVFNEPVVVEEPSEEKDGVIATISGVCNPICETCFSILCAEFHSFFHQAITNIGTQAPTAANKPIALNTQHERKGKNEVYVDLIERLTVVFNSKVNNFPLSKVMWCHFSVMSDAYNNACVMIG